MNMTARYIIAMDAKRWGQTNTEVIFSVNLVFIDFNLISFQISCHDFVFRVKFIFKLCCMNVILCEKKCKFIVLKV